MSDENKSTVIEEPVKALPETTEQDAKYQERMNAGIIRLTYGEIKNENFISVFQRLIESKLHFQVTANLLALAKLVNGYKEDCNKLIARIYHDLGEEVSEEGKPTYKKIKDENSEEAQKQFAELMHVELETGFTKFNPSILMGIGFELNVNELVAIQPIFHKSLTLVEPTSSSQPLSVVQ